MKKFTKQSFTWFTYNLSLLLKLAYEQVSVQSTDNYFRNGSFTITTGSSVYLKHKETGRHLFLLNA